ncbi:hypothetical protein Vretifemale_17344, partial [Volvox reticuliferus]
DETVRLWDLMPKSTLDRIAVTQARDFKGIQGTITVLCMAPDGQVLASGSDDHTLRLWSTRSNQQLMVLQGHGSPVSALAFDDQAMVLSSGSVCGTVLVWCKDAAGSGSRGGWSQVAKLELALQVSGRMQERHAGQSSLQGLRQLRHPLRFHGCPLMFHSLQQSADRSAHSQRFPWLHVIGSVCFLLRYAQVPDAAVSALALTHYYAPLTTSATSLTSPLPAPSSGFLYTAEPASWAAAGGGAVASTLTGPAAGGARLLLACGTKPRDMASREAAGAYGGGFGFANGGTGSGARRIAGRAKSGGAGAAAGGDDDFFGGRLVRQCLLCVSQGNNFISALMRLREKRFWV